MANDPRCLGSLSTNIRTRKLNGNTANEGLNYPDLSYVD